jgi:phospholipid-transporting ATPase
MLYEFKGTLKISDEELVVLSEDSLLLRGARLKNTSWIHGVVVYSGRPKSARVFSPSA